MLTEGRGLPVDARGIDVARRRIDVAAGNDGFALFDGLAEIIGVLRVGTGQGKCQRIEQAPVELVFDATMLGRPLLTLKALASRKIT